MTALLILLGWFILWTMAIHKFNLDEKDVWSKVVLLLTAPLFHLFVFLFWGINGYTKKDWNNLAD